MPTLVDFTVGATVGAALGVAVQFALPALLADMLPVKLEERRGALLQRASRDEHAIDVGPAPALGGNFSAHDDVVAVVLEDGFDLHLGANTVLVSPNLPQCHQRLRMRVGRVARHWSHNCVAIGLAQGFIEPLEATALMLILC